MVYKVIVLCFIFTYEFSTMLNKKYDWQEIQKFYDEGHTWSDITNRFGVCQSAILGAKKRGDFISRNHSQANKIAHSKNKWGKHTEETKQKISKARIKYLEENPDKVPYLVNHSSKQSYPEKIFQNALISSNISGWDYNYRVGLYQYDFAFVTLKIDVEIDGATHNTPKVKKIDARRDSFSKSNGWIVIRFTAKQVKENVIGCINELKKVIESRGGEI